MIARFELTPAAARQLAASYAQLFEQSPKRAELEALKNFLRRCPVAADAIQDGAEVCDLLYDPRSGGPYPIHYRIADDVLQIVAILHSSRG